MGEDGEQDAFDRGSIGESPMGRVLRRTSRKRRVGVLRVGSGDDLGGQIVEFPKHSDELHAYVGVPAGSIRRRRGLIVIRRPQAIREASV